MGRQEGQNARTEIQRLSIHDASLPDPAGHGEQCNGRCEQSNPGDNPEDPVGSVSRAARYRDSQADPLFYDLGDVYVRSRFHAKYQGEEVIIEIDTGNVVGKIKDHALGLIQDWRQLHRKELMENWKLAQQKRILMSIEPLE